MDSEEISHEAMEKLKKITELVKGIERDCFETGTEVTPPGSSHMPPDKDRQTSPSDDSHQQKTPVRESN